MDRTPEHNCENGRFALNRHTRCAVLLLLLMLFLSSNGAGQDRDVVHLSGSETIAGFKTDTNSWTFSNPASTLLLGDTSIPNLTSTIPGGQLLISTSGSDSHWPFAVISGYRNGVSGERYLTGFAPDGHFSTNQYIVVSGGGYGVPGSPPYMTYIGQDVGIGILQVGAFKDSGPSSNVKLYEGWGPADGGGSQAKVFDLGTQGTIWLFNPYGQTGAIQYDLPQMVLGDIGTNYASPSWTYGSMHQKSGHTYIGTYTGSGDSTNESKEIDINNTTHVVSMNGASVAKISDQLLDSTASSVTFTNIPQTYTHLKVVSLMRVNTTTQQVWMTFNGDTGSNYRGAATAYGANKIWSGVPMGQVGGTDSYDSFQASMVEVSIPFYTETTFDKQANAISALASERGGAENTMLGSHMWLNTSAITSITITPQSGSFIAGSHFILYGYN